MDLGDEDEDDEKVCHHVCVQFISTAAEQQSLDFLSVFFLFISNILITNMEMRKK